MQVVHSAALKWESVCHRGELVDMIIPGATPYINNETHDKAPLH